MANIQDVTKSINITPVVAPIDADDGAIAAGAYIHAKLYDGIAIVCMQGVEAAATTITIEQCTDGAGTGAKAFTTGKNITCVAATTQTAIIEGPEFDSTTTPPFEWVKVSVNDPGAASLVAVLALGFRGRYAEDTMPSMLV